MTTTNNKASSHVRLPVHGWLILDKPQGLTSTQALGKVRRFLGGKKAGHGGTLDPLATGILPLALGEATKLIPYVMDGDKEYEFTVRWGEARDTDDAEGKVINTSPQIPTEADIKAALPAFTGAITQIPPAYSAIKLDGERAYDIARAGGIPELKSRQVTIYSLELLPHDHHVQNSHSPLAEIATLSLSHFRVRCGKGMYVRSLARDLAVKLGTFGYVASLRRTRVGPFGLQQAVSLPRLENAFNEGTATTHMQPIRAALGNIPLMALSPAEAQNFQMGRGVLIRPQHMHLIDAPLIFAEHQGVPVAVIESHAGEFRVLRGFHF